MALRQTDRVLVLEKLNPKSSDGLFDPDVFTGKNNLHVVMDSQSLMWTFKYERGTIPPQLRGKFTHFKAALSHAELFMKNKNIKIVEVKD